ncbi:uncharacterized protein LOC121373851 isoform X2 [Gigantopelta aegis]|nr:uncharacterized protein LOC121373851 isoform X2 [Gigantopelta aegis]
MDSSTDDSSAYVPGVSLNRPGNLRPANTFKMRGRRTPEVKPKIPLVRPMEDLPTGIPQDEIQQHQVDVSHPHRNHTRKLSFKDLRPEDKQRVANLIKELAKTGEEKEKVMSQLQDERERYEKQIVQLVEQQEEILQEREEIQKRFFDSQRLLNKYQEELLQEQERQKSSVRKTVMCSTWNTKPTDLDNCVLVVDRARSVETPGDFEPRSSGDVVVRTAHTGEELHNGNMEDLNAHFPPANHDRPYTAQIDREIAQQNYVANGLAGTCDLIQVQPLVAYKPQRTPRYPKNPVRSRPFHEPIMSSTQKSSVMEEVSLTSIHTAHSEFRSEFHSLPRDDSPGSLHSERDSQGDERNHETRGGGKVRVGFLERADDRCGDGGHVGKLHSPDENRSMNNDQEFIRYYKKLTPEERRQKLLQQKRALLEEQQRLKQILIHQEKQLCEKQEILKWRHLERKKGLERQLASSDKDDKIARLLLERQLVGSEGTNSRLPKPQFVNHAGTNSRLPEPRFVNHDGEGSRLLERQLANVHRASKTSRLLDDQCGHSHADDKVSRFVERSPRGRYADVDDDERVDLNKATYIIDSDDDDDNSRADNLVKRLDYSGMSDASHNARERLGVRSRISAATSPISMTRISVGTSPLRQDGSGVASCPPLERVDAGTSVSYRHISRTPPRPSPRQGNLPLHIDRQDSGSPELMANSPVENGLSILEIVDSIQDGRLSHNVSLERPEQITEERIHTSREQSFREHSFREQSLHEDVDEEENLEESRILEEIFFLK